MEEDEKEIHEHIENERFYQFATPRKGILLKRLSQRRNNND